MEVEEELTKSYYAYGLANEGMWRVDIPDEFDETELNIESKLENVFTYDPNRLPSDMGIFSTGNKVYMVGGKNDNLKFYTFDTNSYGEGGRNFLRKKTLVSSDPIVSPLVIHLDSKIYFLTKYANPWFGESIESMCLQSFDPTFNLFITHSSPPYTPGKEDPTFRVAAHFAAFNYIYLFIQGELKRGANPMFDFDFTSVLSFDTTKFKWKKQKKMIELFKKNEVPIPFLHRGDTGVSDVFDDGSQIMLALCDTTPTAYLVTHSQSGSINPISFRVLEEIKSKDPLGVVQLHTIGKGKGRFCAFYQSFHVPLKILIFEIDFVKEHEIQCNDSLQMETSSKMLCSMNFLHENPSIGYPAFNAYCLASHAPAPQSSRKLNLSAFFAHAPAASSSSGKLSFPEFYARWCNQIVAVEGQLDGKPNETIGKRKREMDGKPNETIGKRKREKEREHN